MRERRKSHRTDLAYHLPAYRDGSSQLIGRVANVAAHGVMIMSGLPIERGSKLQLRIRLSEENDRSADMVVEAICRWCQRDANSTSFRSGLTTATPVGDLVSVLKPEGQHLISMKRLLDVVVSLTGLLLLSPLFILIGLAVRAESQGSVFYTANRMGRFGRPFRMYKFRTMSPTVENTGPAVTAHDDPRVTKLGRLLRQTKFNELPQLLNVVRGEMSLVGPRPEDPDLVKHYAPEERDVLSVSPGITSLASIIYADEERRLTYSNVTEQYLNDILPDKLRLDLLYIRSRSLLLDLDILIQTLLLLIPRWRRATPRAADLLHGPLRKAQRYATWITMDAIVAFAAVTAAGVLWRSAGPLHVGLVTSLVAAVAMTAVFTISSTLLGAQNTNWRFATPSDALAVIASATSATFLLLMANLLIPPPRFPQGMLIITGVLALSGLLVSRYIQRFVQGARARIDLLKKAPLVGSERILIVGAGEVGRHALLRLRNNSIGKDFQVVGVLDDDLSLLGTLVHRVPVLATCEEIPDVVCDFRIDIILYSSQSAEGGIDQRLLRRCLETSARTIVLPDILAVLRQALSDNGRSKSDWTPTSFGGQGIHTMVGQRELVRQELNRLIKLARGADLARVASELGWLEHRLEASASTDTGIMLAGNESQPAPQP